MKDQLRGTPGRGNRDHASFAAPRNSNTEQRKLELRWWSWRRVLRGRGREGASPNVLVARADVPEDYVYQITKVIWENLATLQEIHGATKDMRLESAVRGLGAPLHVGALRYFREVGLDVPERLIPEEAKATVAPVR